MKRIGFIVIGISIIITGSVIGYFVYDISKDPAEISGFAKITNSETKLAQRTLFLSVTVDDNIPENTDELLFDNDSIGFGYAWLGPDKMGHDGDLAGFFANIHKSTPDSEGYLYDWHVEPVWIESSTGHNSDLCVFGLSTNSEITVDENSVKAILPAFDIDISPDELDRTLSLEIVMDNGCHFGFGVNILYSSLEKTS